MSPRDAARPHEMRGQEVHPLCALVFASSRQADPRTPAGQTRRVRVLDDRLEREWAFHR